MLTDSFWRKSSYVNATRLVQRFDHRRSVRADHGVGLGARQLRHCTAQPAGARLLCCTDRGRGARRGSEELARTRACASSDITVE